MDFKYSVNDEPYVKKATLYQVFASLLANTALLGSGMSLGYTAIALPCMQQPDSPVYIDNNQASWVASLASIATPIGCLLSGHILDNFGRRAALLAISFPLFFGWLLIAVHPTLEQIYVGRILTGISTGLASIPSAVYVAEITENRLRGFLVMSASVAIASGVTVVYTLGLLLKCQWQLVAMICAAFPVMSVVLHYFLLPESPVWLVTKNRIGDASRQLAWLRGARHPDDVQQEIDQIVDRARKNKKSGTLSLVSSVKALARPEAYKPLLIMNTFFFFQQLTGVFVVIFYAVDVVIEAGVTVDPFLVTVYIGVTRLVFTVLAAWMSKTFGRRPPAIISGIGMSLSLMTLATYLYLNSAAAPALTTDGVLNSTLLNATVVPAVTDQTSSKFSFIPLTMLLLYILSSTVGFLTLPWSMIGEVYPTQIRGFLSGLTTCVAYGISFFTIKTYPLMKELLHKHGVFYLYGTMAVLGTIFVMLFLPETEGKSLQEIEQKFAKSRESRSIGDVRNEEEQELAQPNSKRPTIVKSSQR